jgi:hypothetical protein
VIGDGIFYAYAIPAVILFGLAKGGFAGLVIIGMSLVAQAISPVKAAAIMLPILMLQDVVSLWAYRRQADLVSLKILLPGAAIGVALGGALAASVSDAAVRLLIGLVAIAFSGNHFLGLGGKLAGSRLTTGTHAGLAWSALSGFTSLVSHAGGPPYQVWMLSRGLDRQIFAGTTAWYFATVNVMKAPFFAGLGLIDTPSLLTAAMLAPIAIAATFLGVWLVRITPAERFVGLIHGLMLMVGLKLLFDGGRALLGGAA